MKITYDFNSTILNAIGVAMRINEIPFVVGHNPEFGDSLWFLAICEEKQKVWCISVRRPSTAYHLELSAAEYDLNVLVPFRDYVLEEHDASGLILYVFFEELETSHKRKVTNFYEFNYQINDFLREIEQAMGAEIEVLDLRNVQFWSDRAEEVGNDFYSDCAYRAYVARHLNENNEEDNGIPF